MDKRDLKYKFDTAKHKVASTLSNPKSYFFKTSGGGYMLTLLAVNSIFLGNALVNDDLDQEVTSNTLAVQEQIQENYETLLATDEIDLEAHKDFIGSLLLSEDLSEEQSNTFLEAYEEHFGETETTVGYEIGSMDDLRESRIDLGTDATAQEIASATVDKQQVEDIFQNLHLGASAVLLFLLMGAGLGLTRSMREAAEKKPRHPRFKH